MNSSPPPSTAAATVDLREHAIAEQPQPWRALLGRFRGFIDHVSADANVVASALARMSLQARQTLAQTRAHASEQTHSLGEVGDLPPGHSGKLTLNLKPGKYLLFCNESGHYADGMKTELTVTR